MVFLLQLCPESWPRKIKSREYKSREQKARHLNLRELRQQVCELPSLLTHISQLKMKLTWIYI